VGCHLDGAKISKCNLPFLALKEDTTFSLALSLVLHLHTREEVYEASFYEFERVEDEDLSARLERLETR